VRPSYVIAALSAVTEGGSLFGGSQPKRKLSFLACQWWIKNQRL